MAFDAANGPVVLFGGASRSRSLNDTWTWGGSAWTEAHPATSPPAISGAQMTYDPITHDLLLVGGRRLGPAKSAAKRPGANARSSAGVRGT